MNAPVKIEGIVPFNPFAAYERERAYSRKVEKMLARACDLLTLECDRREHRGEDVARIRAFVSRAREVQP